MHACAVYYTDSVGRSVRTYTHIHTYIKLDECHPFSEVACMAASTLHIKRSKRRMSFLLARAAAHAAPTYKLLYGRPFRNHLLTHVVLVRMACMWLQRTYEKLLWYTCTVCISYKYGKSTHSLRSSSCTLFAFDVLLRTYVSYIYTVYYTASCFRSDVCAKVHMVYIAAKSAEHV